MSTELFIQGIVETTSTRIVTVQELQQLVQAANLSFCSPVPALTLQCSHWTIDIKLEFLQLLSVTLCQVRRRTIFISALFSNGEF